MTNKSTKRKTTQRGGNRGTVADAMVVHRGIGMPRQFRTKVRMVTTGVASITGTATILGYGCNTPGQPCRSTTTTEVPAYFTKLAGLYDRVYTLSSRITVQTVNTTVADSVQVVLSNDGNIIVPGSMLELMERTGARSSVLGYYTGGSTAWSASSGWTPRPFIGVSPDSPDNTSVGSADPPNPYFWVLAMQSLGGGTGNLAYKAIIEYDLVFHELTNPY